VLPEISILFRPIVWSALPMGSLTRSERLSNSGILILSSLENLLQVFIGLLINCGGKFEEEGACRIEKLNKRS